MTKKPVVLVIENSIHVTGALKSITRTAHDLQSFFDFVFVIPKKSMGRSWIEKIGSYRIVEIPMLELSKRFFSVMLYLPLLTINAFRLRRIIKQNQIALIHVNDLYNLLPVAGRLLGMSTPYMCHVRFMPNHFPGWLFGFWIRLHLRYAESIIGVSQNVVNLLPKHRKISMIYNELPLEEIYAETESSHDEPFIFLCLSNFMEGKGHNFAIEAFADIHESLPNWKLRFVGSDMGLKKNKDYIIKLKRKAKTMDIARKIEWLGFTNDVEREYKHADIVLNFSESESFSKTCLEALFYGRPLIASDCGGPAEIIEHGITGVLVENRNKKQMANAMKKMASEKEERDAMGKRARIAVRKKFSVENTSFQMRDIYMQIVRGS
jgi:L-malate glycosyltransferase